MNDRKWNSLISGDNSPLRTVHTTIYFRNPAALTSLQLEKLLDYISQTELTRQNRLIFSLIQNSAEFPESETVRTCLETRLPCLTLRLPPLRERTADLPSITALCLHELNMSMGGQIIGFEAEAMERMTAFSWPRNLNQLHHVLRELVVMTHTAYITDADVAQVLAQEAGDESSNRKISDAGTGPAYGESNLTGTLDDITWRAVSQVLKEEHGNREKTAQRLDISRSTLWRMLKNHAAQI